MHQHHCFLISLCVLCAHICSACPILLIITKRCGGLRRNDWHSGFIHSLPNGGRLSVHFARSFWLSQHCARNVHFKVCNNFPKCVETLTQYARLSAQWLKWMASSWIDSIGVPDERQRNRETRPQLDPHSTENEKCHCERLNEVCVEWTWAKTRDSCATYQVVSVKVFYYANALCKSSATSEKYGVLKMCSYVPLGLSMWIWLHVFLGIDFINLNEISYC